jgi:hypothetical protein
MIRWIRIRCGSSITYQHPARNGLYGQVTFGVRNGVRNHFEVRSGPLSFSGFPLREANSSLHQKPDYIWPWVSLIFQGFLTFVAEVQKQLFLRLG